MTLPRSNLRAALMVVVVALACGDTSTTSGGGGQVLAPPAATDSAFRAIVREATFVFVGTVVRRGGVTDPDVRQSRLASVVRVDSVLRGPPGAGNFAGDTLTVISLPRDTVGLANNQEAMFFAYGLAAGETIIVRSTLVVGAVTPAIMPTAAMAFSEALRQDADEALSRRARRAALVVFGIVGAQSVVAIPDSIQRRYGSERTPTWLQATIRNGGYLGGDSTLMGATWGIYYPVSEDENRAWLRGSLTAGDTLILLLRRADSLPSAMLKVVSPAGRFFVFDSVDVLPRSDSTRVRRALP